MARRRCASGLALALLAAGIAWSGATGALAAEGRGAAAAGYPARAIRLIVPFPPGGGADITARTVAEKLSEALRQQVVIDNRPGAGGNVAGVLAARAAADGYTLYAITASTAVSAAIYENLGYDPVTDFAPVGQISALPYTVAINAASPVRSVKDLLALARAKPGAVSYGSNGIGGLSHVSGELLAAMSGTKLLHVPYKGGAQALTDVLSGQITLLFATPLLSTPHVRSGKVRLLAVTTRARSSALPDVPTLSEAGVPGYEVASWNGLLAPRATPAAIVAKLNAETIAALAAVRERLSRDGSAVAAGTPAQFGALIRADIEKWRKLAREIGLKPQ